MTEYDAIQRALASPATVEIVSCPDGSWLANFHGGNACFVLPLGSEPIAEPHIIAAVSLDEVSVEAAVRDWLAREFPGHSALTFERGWFGP